MPRPGERRTTTEEYRRRECYNCGEPATIRHGFLFHDYRRNPASTAFGRNDCSYCTDAERYACGACDRTVRCPPRGMEWASSTLHKPTLNDHLFHEWVKLPPDP